MQLTARERASDEDDAAEQSTAIVTPGVAAPTDASAESGKETEVSEAILTPLISSARAD